MFSAKKRGKCALSAAFETDQKNFKTVKKKYLTPCAFSCMITKVIAVEKILEQTLLYDFYGELLTQHQKEVYGEYIQNDLSPTEIAVLRGISRQGAYDLIKRCEKILTDYENRLHLVEHFQKVKKTVASIHTCAEEIAECDDKSVVREKIAQIAELSSKILEEY